MTAFVIAETLQATGKLAEAETRYEDALDWFAQANALHRAAEGIVYGWSRCLRGLGIANATQGKYEPAREYYLAALAMLDPEFDQHPLIEVLSGLACSIRYSLAATEVSLKNWTQVEEILLRNIQSQDDRLTRFPDLTATISCSQGENFNLLYVCYSASRDHSRDEAEQALQTSIDWYHRAIETNSKWSRPQLALARAENNMGNLIYARGDLDLAKAWKMKALTRNQELLDTQPDGLELRNSQGLILSGIAKICSDQGDLDEALVYCNRMLDLIPNHHQSNKIRVERARIVARLGDDEMAFQLLEEFTENWAIHDDDFIMAASGALLIADLIEHDHTTGVASQVDQREQAEKFRKLGLALLQRGLTRTASSQQDYFEKCRQKENLRPLVEMLEGEN